ncbi:hypothetical protein MRY87_06170 [bacterium]|nr:hypothetical protein [bacterium]
MSTIGLQAGFQGFQRPQGGFGQRAVIAGREENSLVSALNINRASPLDARAGVSAPRDAVSVQISARTAASEPKNYTNVGKLEPSAPNVRAQQPRGGDAARGGDVGRPDAFSGTFKGDTLFLDQGAALQFRDNGEVSAYLAGPDGGVVRGSGTINEDGELSLTFENGQSFTSRLERNGDSATLSDIRYEGQAPVISGLSDGKNAVFDGISLEATGDGTFDVTIESPNGQTIRGSLVQTEDGQFIAQLDNGQTYGGTLSFADGKATLTNLELLKNDAPGQGEAGAVAQPQVSREPVAPREPSVAAYSPQGAAVLSREVALSEALSPTGSLNIAA